MPFVLPQDKWTRVLFAAVATLVYLLAAYLIGFAIENAAGGHGEYRVLASFAMLLICGAAFLFWGRRREENGLSLAVAAVMAVVAGAVACAIGLLSGIGQMLPPTMLNITCAGIAAPIAEELLFRGVMQGRLEESAGPVFALIVSSVLFGVSHIGAGGALAVLASCAAGLLFGTVYLKTRSVAWSIVAHIVANLAAFALAAVV